MSDEADSDPADGDEPAVNISGGADGGGAAAAFDPGTADTRAERVVDRLGELYWQKTYGGQDAFTCLVRTILSQNTSDVASQPAHDALIERYGPDGGVADADGRDGETGGETESTHDLAATLADADREAIAETISSAGLYNQKSRMIQEAAEWVRAEFGAATAFDAYVRETAPATVRDELLSVHGVGPKTADCVLLFAGGQNGVFPVKTVLPV